MGAKYKFKLEGLLKIRRFKEEKLKVELGKINQEIQSVQERIEELKEHVDQSYTSQEQVLKSSANGQLARFFPYYIQAKREDIKNQENLLYSLKKKYQAKLEEVSAAMGESKIVSNMKDKDFESWKKEMLKKEQENLEEIITMRRRHQEDGL